ncbi:hypothetical protein [Prochlorococcus marinus]|nr:hypothetical protein [Prochlorococcus marinus]
MPHLGLGQFSGESGCLGLQQIGQLLGRMIELFFLQQALLRYHEPNALL